MSIENREVKSFANSGVADVLVVGAGMAGLRTATLLARAGHDVLLIDRRPALARPVRTTGIFVRRTLDDFALPAEFLGPAIRRVALYPPLPGRPVVLTSPRDEFRVGDMGPLYAAMGDEARAAGVRVALGTRFTAWGTNTALVSGPEGPAVVRARFLVGADGARSRVARMLGLDVNRRFLVGAEQVHPTSPTGEPTFHCVLDPHLAPGYLAWVVDDGRHAHIGLAGRPDRYRHGIRAALAEFRTQAAGLIPRATGPTEHRAGLIPVGGVLDRIACGDGLLVGDAAGAVSPLTAGGLDPCLRLSDLAADLLGRALAHGPAELAAYDGAGLRSRFRTRLLMRHGMDVLRGRTLGRLGVAALRTPPGRAMAGQILFGDRSFPLPSRPRVPVGLPVPAREIR